MQSHGRFGSFTKLFVSLFMAVLAHDAEARLAELLVTDSGVRRPIELSGASVDVLIDESSARITYDLTFGSRLSGNREGTFYFALPRNSYVHEFGMWVNGEYQGSAIVEAKAGRVAYESIVRRGVDPALLEWTAGNNFKMRVFPIVSEKPTRIKLTVGLPADAISGALKFSLPMDTGKVGNLAVRVHGHARTKKTPQVLGMKGLKVDEIDTNDGIMDFDGKFDAKNMLPPDSIAVSIQEADPDEMKVRRGDGDNARFFETRVFPDLGPEKRDAATSATILWDFSLSEEAHVEARMEALRAYLSARKPKTVDIYGFNQRVFTVSTNAKGEFNSIAAALKAQPYDGGTRLDLLADFLRGIAGKNKTQVTDLVLFTNGVDSFELFDFKRIKRFGHKNLNAFIISPSVGANGAMLSSFARALSAVVLDQDQDLVDSAFTSKPWTLVKAKGSKQLTSLELPAQSAVFAGDGVRVRGQVKKDGGHEMTLTFKRSGKSKSLTYKIDTGDTKLEDHSSVPRMWAASRIERLLPEKRKHAEEIKRLALDHQLMSPYSVMVVLEFCEDYAEFKLDAPKDCKKRQVLFDSVAEGGDAAFDMEEGEAAAEDDDASESSVASEAPASAGEDLFLDAAGDGGGAPMAKVDVPSEAADAPAPSDIDEVIADFEETESDYANAPVEKDTESRPYGFENTLASAAKKGVAAFYAEYLKNRAPFEKIPFYYIFAADHLVRLKRQDLADLVLSNVVEVRPGDARWLRIYAYSLIAWGKAKDTVPIYRAIAELRDEDPQSHRDFGLAMEAIGQPVAAMRLFERVYVGKWDARLVGMSKIIQHDLARAASAALKTQGLSSENKSKAEQYAKVDASVNDKIVVTVGWDTDNTDIDLHAIEPNGSHVYFGNLAPAGASGKLSFDTTQGFGPEQYRNAKPHRGKYRFYLRYYSQNAQALQDGTFVRVDVKVVQKGVSKTHTSTVFLKDQNEIRTILDLDYQDPSAPLPPASFQQSLSNAKTLHTQKRYAESLATLDKLGKQANPKHEALRHFHMARARLALKQFAEAEMANQRALALDPKLIAAHYNNACAASLAKDSKKALHHLNLLADALEQRSDQREYFMSLMKTDTDLTFVRPTKDFKSIEGRIKVGH